MTREELSQLYHLNQEIEQEQHRLIELESAATNCSQKLTGMPCVPGISDKVECYAIEIAELKSLIEQNIKKCWEERKRLEQYIQTIPDSEMRLIIRLRCVECKTWPQVAFGIGHYDEQYPRKKFNKFLKCTENTDYLC